MRVRLFLVVLSLLTFVAGSAWAQTSSLTVHEVSGLDDEGDLPTDGSTVTFTVAITNGEGENVRGITNGFRVYSDSGAGWTTMVGDTLPLESVDGNDFAWAVNFGIVFEIGHYSITGSGADSVSFGGSGMGMGLSIGLPSYFDTAAYTITIGPFSPDDSCKTICFDSSFCAPSTVWKWQGSTAYFPAWYEDPFCYFVGEEMASGVRTDAVDNLPTTFALGQNYPNPFNPYTQIKFDIPSRSHVSLTVYNVLGQRVATLVDETLSRGRYTADWDADRVSTGVYFYRLEAGDFTETRKMVLLK